MCACVKLKFENGGHQLSLRYIIRKFEQTGLQNDIDCPILLLDDDIVSVLPKNIVRPLSIIHQCDSTCTPTVTSHVYRRIEREDIEERCDSVKFLHNFTNSMYCLNVYAMNEQ